MIAKVTILFAALAAVHASALLGHGALVSTGVSTSARSQDVSFGNYALVMTSRTDSVPPTPDRRGDAHGNKKDPTPLLTSTEGPRVDYVADGQDSTHRQDQRTRNPPAPQRASSPAPTPPRRPVVNHVAPVVPAVAAPVLSLPQRLWRGSRTRGMSRPFGLTCLTCPAALLTEVLLDTEPLVLDSCSCWSCLRAPFGTWSRIRTGKAPLH
ncbi:hypothetical protein TNIN_160981 [Trichonephila inaurata madagascariensis]|uniref:Uncharacterized protein n=1 Tax=Trichonephila inaurata madagascariensis TaxID=2747483 RepID=A0A8X7C0J3_9ARAC|nr:hypothetical protein TNIN_160981 [Trichonephila inaurata madagascariensis]